MRTLTPFGRLLARLGLEAGAPAREGSARDGSDELAAGAGGPSRRSWLYDRVSSLGPVSLTAGLGLGRPSAARLRSFARTPFARRALNAIKNPIAALDFEIALRPGLAPLGDDVLRAEALRRAFERPNEEDSFRSLLEQVIEDLLMGAGAIEQAQSPGDARPFRLWPVDGLSVSLIPTWDGHATSPRYVQGLIGGSGLTGLGGGLSNTSTSSSLSVTLAAQDLIYLRPNPQTASPQGLGPLEVAYQAIGRLLAVEDHAGKLAANARPSVMINLGPEVSVDQIAAFRAYWRDTGYFRRDDLASHLQPLREAIDLLRSDLRSVAEALQARHGRDHIPRG